MSSLLDVSPQQKKGVVTKAGALIVFISGRYTTHDKILRDRSNEMASVAHREHVSFQLCPSEIMARKHTMASASSRCMQVWDDRHSTKIARKHRPFNLLARIKKLFSRTGEGRQRFRSTSKPTSDAVRIPEIVTIVLGNLSTEDLLKMSAVSFTFQNAIFKVKQHRRTLFLEFDVRPILVPGNTISPTTGPECSFNPLLFTDSSCSKGYLALLHDPLNHFMTLPPDALCRKMYLTQQPAWFATLYLTLRNSSPSIYLISEQAINIEIRITRFRTQGIKYQHILDLVADQVIGVQARRGWTEVELVMEETRLEIGVWRGGKMNEAMDANRIAEGGLVVLDDLSEEGERLREVRKGFR
ncbi:unnamed protein product [Zymoseptoria tritici ST99CH_3D1]|nr:unnamed protein product [Zymoseptoria tritici ST99CH_3D1]